MTLVRGNHVVKLDQDDDPIMEEEEYGVVWEVFEVSPSFQLRDPNTGEFSHEGCFALLKKIR